jgi:hypothetical protein
MNAVNMKIILLWEVIPYTLVEISQGFEGIFCLLLGTQQFHINTETPPEDELSWVLKAGRLVVGI